MTQRPKVVWPEFIQFGDANTPGPRIPLDRDRAEKALRKNLKAFQGIAQAKTVFFTAVIRDMSKRPYEIIRRRYITEEEVHGLLWCCIEKGNPPHVRASLDRIMTREPERDESEAQSFDEFSEFSD